MQDCQHNVRKIGNSDTYEGIWQGVHEKFILIFRIVEEDVKEKYDTD